MKKLSHFTLLTLSLLMTTSCVFLDDGSASGTDKSNTASTESQTSNESVDGKVSESSSKAESSYSKLKTNFTQQDFCNITDYPYMPSTGEVNVLVIPVVVSDYKKNATDKVKQDIETAMFGDANETGWESLASFYEKSSYGKLKIKGTVSDWYNPNLTSTQMSKKDDGNGSESTSLLQSAVNWYKSTYNTDCSEFDNNNDGYIDGVFLIYSAPDYSQESKLDSSLFWAYTTMDYDATSATTGANPCYYFWASYDFIYSEYGNSQVDAHTFIHETGHMLSLQDYYSYTTKDKSGYTSYSPMGDIAMMDHNVCDLDAFSKFDLDWVEPYYVDKAGTITIDSTTLSGDCIIIPTTKSDVENPYDEYIMIEFLTIDGLNQQDLTEGYESQDYYNEITKDGIRVYHVDNRLCQFSSDNYGSATNIKYVTDISKIDVNNYYYYTSHENTPAGYDGNGDYSSGYNYLDPDYRTITQLSKSGRVFATNDYRVNDKDLYHEGDIFTFSDSSMQNQFPNKSKTNDGSDISFSFMVDKIEDKKATISFFIN